MSSFIKTTTCQKVTTKCFSGNLYAPQEDKDVLISKLTTKINKLEQQEKDFELLNQEFKQLENDYTLLNEAKLRLEYEIKQRDEAYNKRICDLKNANENLQNGLNDKMCVNKKLYEEKQCLENTLNGKNDEIADLNDKINNLNDRLGITQNNKDDLQNNLNDLNDIKSKQRDKIADLVNDNKRLAKLCQEQDHSLYLADQEKQKLSKKIMEDNADINNLNSKLRAHGNNLNNLQKQLDNSNEVNLKLKENVKNLENEFTTGKIDNENLNNELCRERHARDDEDKKNEQLKCILCDRENKIKYLCNDYERMKIAHQKMTEERSIYQNENDKLKEHIMILTRQNQDLTSEIDNVIRDDEHMKDVLNRSERMEYALKDNDSILSQLPNEVLCVTNSEDTNFCSTYKENKLFLSQTNVTREVSHSPRCTYTFESQ
jgi:chromosome segregation protein